MALKKHEEEKKQINKDFKHPKVIEAERNLRKKKDDL